ncbi:histidine kinase [Kribbella sp. NPDC026611]|uniref:sensor histidine kinase n=1 Tax=Kribbella sp. NPDC026611 TaxID=3154911 RepID=UPI0033E4F071
MRRSLILDACLAVIVAGVAVPSTLGGASAVGVLGAGRGVTGWGWLLFAAVHMPLVWRRRWPVVVFWAVLGVVGVCVAIGVTGVFLVLAPLFALYTLTRHAAWEAVWPGLGASVAVLAVAGVFSGAGWTTLVGISAVLAVGCLMGIAWRLRAGAAAERTRHLRQELAAEARMAAEAQREELAREVHDVVAHNLAVMVALADGALATIETDRSQATDLIERSAATGRSALGEMRRLVGVLRTADRPTLSDLPGLITRVQQAGLHVSLTGTLPEVPAEVGFVAYRIIQESLTNTLKHGGDGVTAAVAISATTEILTLTITDTGGSPSQRAPGGHGLDGLAERVAACGGTFSAGPAEAGWRVEAVLRLEAGG